GRTKAEARCTGTARVEHEAAVDLALHRPVRVAVHDDVGTGMRELKRVRRGRSELVAVNHHDLPAGKLHLADLGNRVPHIEAVRIPPDSRDRRDRFQLRDQGRRADVAGMQDVLDAREVREYLRAEYAVRVGDDADAHASQSVPGAISPDRQRGPTASSIPRCCRMRPTTKSMISSSRSGRW